MFAMALTLLSLPKCHQGVKHFNSVCLLWSNNFITSLNPPTVRLMLSIAGSLPVKFNKRFMSVCYLQKKIYFLLLLSIFVSLICDIILQFPSELSRSRQTQTTPHLDAIIWCIKSEPTDSNITNCLVNLKPWQSKYMINSHSPLENWWPSLSKPRKGITGPMTKIIDQAQPMPC